MPVHRISDLTASGGSVERELALIKVKGSEIKEWKLFRIADIFRAHVIDSTGTSLCSKYQAQPKK